MVRVLPVVWIGARQAARQPCGWLAAPASGRQAGRQAASQPQPASQAVHSRRPAKHTPVRTTALEMSAPKRAKLEPTLSLDGIEEAVRKAVSEVEIVDLHTHLLPPSFGEMMLYGVDELLTYHYLTCEFFQTAESIRPDDFFALPKVPSGHGSLGV